MPQLRQDPATEEWVIIATERSKRPDDFKKAKSINEKPRIRKIARFVPVMNISPRLKRSPIEGADPQQQRMVGEGRPQ